MGKEPLLNVKIQSPVQILYQGQALAVSSKDSKGKFDILPFHTNFIALIEKQPVEILKPNKKLLIIGVNQAIVVNRGNQVYVYVDLQGPAN